MPDMINSPEHYAAGGIETIDSIKSSMVTAEMFNGYLQGNIIKYASRCFRKNEDPTEDLKKMIWYANRLIKEVEENA